MPHVGLGAVTALGEGRFGQGQARRGDVAGQEIGHRAAIKLEGLMIKEVLFTHTHSLYISLLAVYPSMNLYSTGII